MPVRLNDTSSPIRIYLHNLALRQQRQRDIESNERAIEQRKFLEQKLKEDTRQFNERLKLDTEHKKALLNLQEAEFRMKGQERLAHGLIPANIQPIVDPMRAMESFNRGEYGPGRTFEKGPVTLAPGIEVTDYQIPEEFGKASLAAQEPLLSAKSRIKQAEELFKYNQQLGLEGFKQKGAIERTKLSTESREKIAEENRKSQENISRLNRESAERRTAATNAIRLQLGNSEGSEHAENIIEQAHSGDFTKEDLARTVSMSKNRREAVINEAARHDVHFLSNKQKDDLNAFPGIFAYLDKVKKLNEVIGPSTSTIGALATGVVKQFDPEVRALQQSLLADQEGVSRILKGLRGAGSNKDIDRTFKGMTPSVFFNKKIDVGRIKDLEEIIFDRLKGTLGNIPVGQKVAILQKIGVPDYAMPKTFEIRNNETGKTFLLEDTPENRNKVKMGFDFRR